jgi:transcriptional regulator with XRE-family HTH domain
MRQGRGLRQEDLAERAGMSRQQVSRVERGLGDLSFDSLIKIANFFDIGVAKLCEKVPKGADLIIDVRRSRREKSDLKFSKVFSEAPKLCFIELSGRSPRRLRIQKNCIYDLLVLKGELTFTSKDYSDQLMGHQALSIKGFGAIHLQSSSSSKKCEILLIQSGL